MDESLLPDIAAGHDRLSAKVIDDAAKAIVDGLQRVIPGDAFEPAFTLGADAPHGMENSIGAMYAIFIVFYLHAECAAREGMIPPAPHPDDTPILDRRHHGAGVRAIVRTSCVDFFGFRNLLHRHGNSPELGSWLASIYPRAGRRGYKIHSLLPC